MLAIAALRQPAQRLAVAKSTLAALAALAILCALPGWSLVHLLSEQPTPHEAITALPSEPTPILPPAATLTPPLETENATIAQPTSSPAASPRPTSPPAAPIDWIALSVAAYAAGSTAATLWLITGALLAHRVRRQATPAPPELQALLQQLCAQEQRAPQLLITPRITAPVALGLRRPTILLPPSAFPLPPSQLLPILAHEWAHLQHRDLHTLAATRLLLILLWPQPLYWLLRRTIRLDQETLADAAAADRAGRLDYAQQLLAWASTASIQRPPRLAGAVGLWEGPSQLKRRIAVLLNEQFNVMRSCSKRWKLISIGCIVSFATMLSLVTLQPALRASEKTEKTSVLSAEQPQGNAERQLEQEQASRMRALVDQLTRTPNVFMGYCIDEAGRPLANVDVSLFVYDSYAKQNVEPVARVQTDVDGKFEFKQPVDAAKEFPDGVPEDNFIEPPVEIIAAVAKSPGLTTEFQNDALYMFVKRGKAAILRMKPAQKLTGRVFDDKEQPVANALVTTTKNAGGYVPGDNMRARTDAEGRFVINDVPSFDAEKEAQAHAAARERGEMQGLYPVPSVLLTVDHPDYATRRMNVEAIPSELDVALAPAATIRGRVVTPSADANSPPRPLAKIPVFLTRTRQPRMSADPVFVYREQQRGVTDADGNYSFTSLPASEYAVTATAPNLTTIGVRGVEAPAGQTVAAPDVVLTPGGIVRVQLVDGKTNEPLKLKAGQKGYVHPRRNPPAIYAAMPPSAPEAVEPPLMDSPIVAFTADAIGEIRLPPGKYALHVDVPLDGANLASITADARQIADEFEVREGETIERTIPLLEVQPAGLGITGVAQPIEQPADGDDSAKKEEGGAAQRPVHFTPAFTPADSNDEGSAPSSSRIIEIDGKQVILGDPIPEAELQDRGSHSTSDHSGERPQVAPPKRRSDSTEQSSSVTPSAAKAEGAVATALSSTRPPSTASDLTIAGRCIDEAGNPVHNTRLWLPLRPEFLDYGATLETVADGEGKFMFKIPSKLRVPSSLLQLSKIYAYEPTHAVGVASVYEQLNTSDLSAVEVRLPPAAATTYRVLDPAGDPVTDARVEPWHLPAGDIYPEALRRLLQNTSNDRGQVTLQGIREADVRSVRVHHADWGEQEFSELNNRRDGGNDELRLSLVGGIKGRVVSEGNGSVAGIPIYSSTQSEFSRGEGDAGGYATTFTDAEGRFEMPVIAAGSGKLNFYVDRDQPWRVRPGGRFTVRIDETVELNVPLERAVRAKGIVRTADTRVPVPHAQVHLRHGDLTGNWMTEQTITDEEGRFEAFVLPGEIRMYIQQKPAEFDPWECMEERRKTPIVVSDDSDTFDLPPIELERTKDVEGLIVDHNDQPLAKVQLYGTASNYIYGNTASDVKGRFVMQLPTSVAIEEYVIRTNDSRDRHVLEVVSESPLKLRKPAPSFQQGADASPEASESEQSTNRQGASKASDPRTPFWTVPASTDVKLTVAVVPPTKADGILINSRVPENETWRLLPEPALKVSKPTTLQDAVK